MISDFWEEKHREESKLSLSGHSGPTVMEALKVNVCDGMNVLEIGVGLGYCTRYIANKGAKVSCVDIAQAALNRVKDIATVYLAENIGKLPADNFDLAISMCVTQHIDDASLAAQLKEVFRSMKAGAIFAMQYSFPFSGQPMRDGYDAMANGEVNRPIEHIYAMVDAAGGKVNDSRIMGIYPQYKSGWGLLHMVKK